MEMFTNHYNDQLPAYSLFKIVLTVSLFPLPWAQFGFAVIMVTITIVLVQRKIGVVLLSQVVAMSVNIFILQLVLIAEFSFVVDGRGYYTGECEPPYSSYRYFHCSMYQGSTINKDALLER